MHQPKAFIHRPQWQAMPARSPSVRTPADIILGNTWHHSTGKTLGRPDYAAWVREIQNYHMNVLGYADVAYTSLIAPDGTIFEGRDRRFVQAHAASVRNTANRQTHGHCFLGDYRFMTVSPQASAAGLFLVELSALFHDQLLQWNHHEWAQYGPPAMPTECPASVEAWVKDTVRPFAHAVAVNGHVA